jgi:hypothetical protein
MKIIASIDSNTVLIQATHAEIVNMHGYSNANDVPETPRKYMCSVGHEIPVSKIHAAARSLHEYQAKELQRAQDAVNSLQDTITRAREVFGPAS